MLAERMMPIKLLNKNLPRISVRAVCLGPFVEIDDGTPAGPAAAADARRTLVRSTGGARGAPLGPPGRELPWPGLWVIPRLQPLHRGDVSVGNKLYNGDVMHAVRRQCGRRASQ